VIDVIIIAQKPIKEIHSIVRQSDPIVMQASIYSFSSRIAVCSLATFFKRRDADVTSGAVEGQSAEKQLGSILTGASHKHQLGLEMAGNPCRVYNAARFP
jgi:hypothetical protein